MELQVILHELIYLLHPFRCTQAAYHHIQITKKEILVFQVVVSIVRAKHLHRAINYPTEHVIVHIGQEIALLYTLSIEL